MTTESPQRLGILGGSFDPVHYGHLLLAETCREQCALDEVWLLPAAAAPHKLQQTRASAKHRVAMLRLAVGGHEAMRVSTMEIDRGGISYTFETLEAIHHERPATELYFLMGADSLEDLPTWREPQRVCQLCVPVVVHRAGSPQPCFDALRDVVDADRLKQFQAAQVTMPIIELTSTELRERVAHGQSIRYRTPRAVEKYIETNGLYKARDEIGPQR
jgi:nicotinate-nucleotide adenylyltransferase